MHPFPKLKNYIAEQVKGYNLNVDERLAMKIIKAIDPQINGVDPIISCNIKNFQGKEHEALVFCVQKTVDRILGNNKSYFEKIILAAKEVLLLRAGNCQYKSYLGFKLALDFCKKMALATFHYVPPLEIQYCDNKPGHFFLIIVWCMTLGLVYIFLLVKWKRSLNSIVKMILFLMERLKIILC
ncbi:hypothetical protein [Legionella gresilensis]|uniref:hypothetical protein n=1 Tax=Legionella gresilensis TaxID=91823 RepID=UPI00104116D3|nr:hypothetical protein [Legionella gresilensis]